MTGPNSKFTTDVRFQRFSAPMAGMRHHPERAAHSGRMSNVRTSLRLAAATLKECRHVMREFTRLTWWIAATAVTVWVLVDAALVGDFAHLFELFHVLGPG